MNNGLGYKLANVPTITGLSTVTADEVISEAISTDQLYVNGVDVSGVIAQVPINTANIALLQQITTGISYSDTGGIDLTTIDNNLDVTGDITCDNEITATLFNGDLNGNANTSTTTSNIVLTSDNNNGSFFIPFSKTAITSNALYIDNSTTPLLYNPSTSTLTCNNINVITNAITGITYNFLPTNTTTINNNVTITQNLTVNTNINCDGDLTVTDLLRVGHIFNDIANELILETGVGIVSGSIQIKPNTTLVMDVNVTEVDFYKPINLNTQNIIGGGTITATTFSGSLTGNADTATSISGGTGGALLYQSSSSTTAKLPIGTVNQVLTSNGSIPQWTNPATPATPNLTQVLLAGNSAGATSINMNSQNITNGGTITATTFSGNLTGNADTASQIAVADNNTSTVMYPTFCSAVAGQKSLLFDTTTGPLSYVPSNGNLRSLQHTIGDVSASNNSLFYQGSAALGIQNNATSGVTNFHTYDASNVLGTRLQISSGAVQANVPLSIFDSATSDNLFLQSTAGGGSWNASTLNGSSLIFAKSSAIELQSLSLTVWSNTNTGVQITPTYSRIGHGGGTTPTSYLQVSNGTSTLEGTTINLSSTTTKLQINSSQVQASVPLIVTDSATSDELGFNAVTTVGNQNPITQAGSSLIYAKTGTIGNQSLTLTCWNSITSGVFISPVYTTIGYGGTTSTPTSNITFTGSASTISGTNVNINNNNFNFGTSTTCKIGYGASTSTSNLIISNTNVSAVNYTLSQNTVIGIDTAATTTAAFAGNTVVGYGALNTATGAVDCVAIGNLAGSGTTLGTNNTFIGSGSGFQASTAGTGSSNTCIGNSAGNGLTTSANGNTLVGSGVASAITTGTNNTCIGSNAGDNITTGSSNICIGSFSTVPTATANGQIAIGTPSDTMYIRGGFNWRNGSQITATTSLSIPLPQFVTVNMGAASQTITIPVPNNTTLLGQTIIFKRKGNTTAFTIAAGAGTPFLPITTITPVATLVIGTTVFQVMLVCDGTNWCNISQT